MVPIPVKWEPVIFYLFYLFYLKGSWPGSRGTLATEAVAAWCQVACEHTRQSKTNWKREIGSAGQVRSFSAFLRSCVRTQRLFRNARTQERKVFQRNASKRNAPPEIWKHSSFCEVRTLLYHEKKMCPN